MKKGYSIFDGVDGCHCLDDISATLTGVVRLLLSVFHYKPSSSLEICGCGLNLLCGALLSRAIPFPKRK